MGVLVDHQANAAVPIFFASSTDFACQAAANVGNAFAPSLPMTFPLIDGNTTEAAEAVAAAAATAAASTCGDPYCNFTPGAHHYLHRSLPQYIYICMLNASCCCNTR